MALVCENCGGILREMKDICPNCKAVLRDYDENMGWYNRYASEIMTEQEAIDFFETDKY